MPLCWPHLHNDVLHVVVLLGVQEGRELLLGGCQVPILVGHLEAPLVPHHHLFVVEAIVRVRIVWEGAQGAPRSAQAGEGPWYPPPQVTLNPGLQDSQGSLSLDTVKLQCKEERSKPFPGELYPLQTIFQSHSRYQPVQSWLFSPLAGWCSYPQLLSFPSHPSSF